MAKKKLQIEYVAVDQLKANPKNPRKNDENVERLVKSMIAFGWTNPILVRRANNMVIAGHTRLRAAQENGLKEVPVVYLDLNEADADVYMVADNKLTEIVQWDYPMLADLFVEFDQLNVDLPLTGFELEEVEALVTGPLHQRPEFDDMIDEFEKGKVGETKKNANWLYVEYYEDDEKFEQVKGFLKDMITAEHQIDKDKFYDYLCKKTKM